MSRLWIITVAAFAVVCLLAFVYVRCATNPRPPLSPRAEDVVTATITTNQGQVGQDTTRSKAAAASGATNYEVGKAYGQIAQFFHQQSKPHANPIAADTDAVRLQKLLSEY